MRCLKPFVLSCIGMLFSVFCWSQKEDSVHELKGKLNQKGDSIGMWIQTTTDNDTLVLLNFNSKGIREGNFIIQDSILVYPANQRIRYRPDDVDFGKIPKAVLLKGQFIDGELEGRIVMSDMDKKRMSITTYKNGLLHGVTEFYDENEKIQSFQTYMDGELDGESAYYVGNTEKSRQFFYENGELIRSKRSSYHMDEESGVLILKNVYEYKEPEHNQDGEWKEFYGSGQPKYEHYYENGWPTGEWKGWYENGQLSYLMVYRDNEIFFFEEYDENGRVR